MSPLWVGDAVAVPKSLIFKVNSITVIFGISLLLAYANNPEYQVGSGLLISKIVSVAVRYVIIRW